MTDPYREQDPARPQEPWQQQPAGAAPQQGQQGAAQQATEQAKQSAQQVQQEASNAGREVADTAKGEAQSVKDDAVREGRRLADQASSTLTAQADGQLNRAAGAVRTVSDDLGRMSRGEQPQNELTADITQQLTERAGGLADWLETHEPADVLAEVEGFARRKPVTFLAIAAGVGFFAGRLTRSMAQSRMDDGSTGGASQPSRALPAATVEKDAWSAPAPMQSGQPQLGQTQPGQTQSGQTKVGQAHVGQAVPPAEPTRPVPPRVPGVEERGEAR